MTIPSSTVSQIKKRSKLRKALMTYMSTLPIVVGISSLFSLHKICTEGDYDEPGCSPMVTLGMLTSRASITLKGPPKPS